MAGQEGRQEKLFWFARGSSWNWRVFLSFVVAGWYWNRTAKKLSVGSVHSLLTHILVCHPPKNCEDKLMGINEYCWLFIYICFCFWKKKKREKKQSQKQRWFYYPPGNKRRSQIGRLNCCPENLWIAFYVLCLFSVQSPLCPPIWCLLLQSHLLFVFSSSSVSLSIRNSLVNHWLFHHPHSIGIYHLIMVLDCGRPNVLQQQQQQR